MAVQNREDNLRDLGIDPWEVPTADAQSTKGKSFMNWQQVLGTIRTSLAVSGPLGALLVKWGVPVEHMSAGIDALIALAAAATPIAAWVWSLFTHKQSNAVAVVAAMSAPEKQLAFLGVPDALKVIAANAVPGVANIRIAPGAPAALTAIAEDPAHPKVTQ
jgi:hypothetical protein